jgi:tetratricopeptide (TPR) repeat protein
MHRFGFIILASVILTACTTQKRKGDVSAFKKKYHNTTAYYNGYFNAEVLLLESTEILEGQVKDNYNKVLDLYKYTAADNPQAVYPQLDKTIEKLTTVVHLHRVAHWTDDSYLMIGKAQYLKQDFESAQETLEYFMQEFTADGKSKSLPTSKKKAKSRSSSSSASKATSSSKSTKAKDKETKKKIKERNKQIKQTKKGKKPSAKDAAAIREARKAAREEAEKPKVENVKTIPDSPIEEVEDSSPLANDYNKTLGGEEYKPKSYFMKHKPSYQEGQIWLARTYVERHNYDNARMYIKQLENDPQTFKEILAQCAAIESYSFLKQKNYQMAILPLRKAIELTKNKKEKARFTYILGQLFEQTGNYSEAANTFDKVVKFHYSPEMDFYAKLRSVINRSKNNTSSGESLAREIERMIKERKYAEFRDQLHYSLALLSLENNDKPKAIEHMEKALSQPNSSRQNQVEIYYTLAKLYHEDENYLLAKKNYDNTLNVMSKTDERRPDCERKAISIADIAKNLAVIAEQDSLLLIADMSEDDKMALALKLKKEKQEADLKDLNKKEVPKSSAPANFYSAGSRQLFFAYDQKNLKRNQRDFEKKWGVRDLEDDWRRSNKSTGGFAGSDDKPLEGGESGFGKKMTTMEMQEILKGIPDSPGALAEANDKISDALFNLGGLFRDKLDRPDKSLIYLNKLEKRYPDNQNESNAFYLMYLDYLDLSRKSDADVYRQKILSKYPESVFAAVLSDPNYFKKKKEEENKLNTYYASTYDFFSKGDYNKAYQMSSESGKLFGVNNNLKSKFALINALSVGNLKGVDEYMQALREVVAKYPNTEEQTRAREILRLLGQRVPTEEVKSSESSNKDTINLPGAQYKNEPDDQHYVIIVLRENGISLNDAKIKASDFNRLYFNLDQLKISNIVIGDNNQMPVIVVRRFNNQSSAMKYYDAITKNRKDFIEDVTLYEIFAISQNNYRSLVANRSVDTYRTFFVNSYLK